MEAVILRSPNENTAVSHADQIVNNTSMTLHSKFSQTFIDLKADTHGQQYSTTGADNADDMPKVQSQPLNLKMPPKRANNSQQEREKYNQAENINCRSSLNFNVQQTTQWHNDPVEEYNMTASQRGICLIINNVLFELDVFSKRKGSDMDAFRFKEIFKQLGFLVECKRNLTADKMKAAFRQISARCMSKHDALVVILLSHGTESGVYGTDGLEVDMNDILTYFDNKKCKQLMGKPKVFIVQACRGRLADYGVKDSQAFFSQPESQTFTQSSQLTQNNLESPKISRWMEVDKNCHPTRTDMLLCFSCHTGYVSTRNEEEGSWLGASLALHLQNESYRRHLIEILNMVSRDVRRRKSADGHKQVLEITSIGFDRNLYFNPGLVEDN